MAIARIESLTYGVDALADGLRFAEDFGLERVSRGGDRAVFATPANQTLQLVAADARDLPRGLEPGSTLRELIWGVDTPAALDALYQSLSRDRSVRADADGVLHTHDDTGYAIGFALTQPRPVVPRRRVERVAGGDAWYRDRTFDAYTRATPLRLLRVTLEIPEEGREAAIDFYRHRVGLEAVPDAVGGGMFLRCDARLPGRGLREGLRLSVHANRPGVDRVAFEVADAEDVTAGGDFMSAQGWRGARRVDRERSGANLFRAFDAPCGGRFEYVERAAEREPREALAGLPVRQPAASLGAGPEAVAPGLPY